MDKPVAIEDRVRTAPRNLGIGHVVQGAEDKLAAWQTLRGELSVAPEDCAHIGDDLPTCR